MMKSLLLFGALFSSLTPVTGPDHTQITFSVQMVLAKSDITSVPLGELLWENQFSADPGQETRLSYLHHNGDAYTFVLRLGIPEPAHRGSQEVSILGYWDAPDGHHTLLGEGETGLTVEGDITVTLFVDDATDEGMHLVITPRVQWDPNMEHASHQNASQNTGNIPGESANPDLFNMNDALVIFNDRVIARNVALQGERFKLHDDGRVLALFSSTPFEDGGGYLLSNDSGRFGVGTNSWHLDLVGKTQGNSHLYVKLLEDPQDPVTSPQLSREK